VDSLTSAFKALSDPIRVRLLKMLLSQGEPVCVCELADALGLPQYRISKHLAILRQAGLVVDSRIGTWVYYSVRPNVPDSIRGVYEVVQTHACGPPFQRDEERLKARLGLREDGRCVLGPNRPKWKEDVS